MKHNTVPLPEDRHHEEVFHEADTFARQILEQRRRNALLPRSEDPLFKEVPVYDGPVPPDVSERHDAYLYGDED